jgi:hypothetical protein
MKKEILNHINDPRQLEILFRSDKALFKATFDQLYPELSANPMASFWHERLNYEKQASTVSNIGIGLPWVIFASLLACFIAKIPAIFNLPDEFFYPRDIGFIVFPILTAFFAWRNKLSAGKLSLVVFSLLAALIFINVLPGDSDNDIVILSCIHLVLFLWAILGFAFSGGGRNISGRLAYLKFNGDLIVMTALILLSGIILSAITIGLFEIIGLNIEEFYFQYIVIFGVSAAPIVGTYLTQSNPNLVGRVSPVIARIFSPLVLIMLAAYMIAILYSGKDPYNDREFLMIFNALLIGVMAIIFFSVAEASESARNSMEKWVLLLLSLLTIIVNGIALSAILFRISEWGITPNRAAVLGANILMLVNLIMVALQLIKVISGKKEISVVGAAIALYLPVYVAWTFVVTFLFPLFFG